MRKISIGEYSPPVHFRSMRAKGRIKAFASGGEANSHLRFPQQGVDSVAVYED
uniref:Uncharacterized protein n=1 Tax=Anguilla anguilla TaxID=7936 RepID=A0A0E9RSH9_ANGAN